MKQQTYLIQIIDTDLFKIGKSKNPERRLAQLAQCQPYEFRLIAVSSKNIEAELHELFSKYSWHLGNGREWFKLSNQALRQVLMFYAEPCLLLKHESELEPTNRFAEYIYNTLDKDVYNNQEGKLARLKIANPGRLDLINTAINEARDCIKTFGKGSGRQSVWLNAMHLARFKELYGDTIRYLITKWVDDCEEYAHGTWQHRHKLDELIDTGIRLGRNRLYG